MTKIVQINDDFHLHGGGTTFIDKLPPLVYTLKFDPMEKGIYLTTCSEFEIPEKIYGDTVSKVERIKTTFNHRGGNTGILLSGKKGSGKTLLAKKLAMDLLVEQEQPIILINIPINGDRLGMFIQKLNQPITFIFDEFEKVYSNPHDQNGLLTILDGMYTSKSLVIFTVNDKRLLVDAMIGRPGRIYYSLHYDGMSTDFIRGYITERLQNHDHIERLVEVGVLSDLNFDQIQAVIEEMNRFNEDPDSAMEMLNIDTSLVINSVRILAVKDPLGRNIPIKDLQNDKLDLSEDFTTLLYKEPNDEMLTLTKMVDRNGNYKTDKLLSSWNEDVIDESSDNRVLFFVPKEIKISREDSKFVVADDGIIITTKDGFQIKVSPDKKGRDINQMINRSKILSSAIWNTYSS